MIFGDPCERVLWGHDPQVENNCFRKPFWLTIFLTTHLPGYDEVCKKDDGIRKRQEVSQASAPPCTESRAKPAHRRPLVLASDRASIAALTWRKGKPFGLWVCQLKGETKPRRSSWTSEHFALLWRGHVGRKMTFMKYITMAYFQISTLTFLSYKGNICSSKTN